MAVYDIIIFSYGNWEYKYTIQHVMKVGVNSEYPAVVGHKFSK